MDTTHTPIPPALFKCEWCPSPGWFPSLTYGWGLVTTPALNVRQTWDYGTSEAIIEGTWPPPGSLGWDTWPWTPDGYAGETGYRDHIIVETRVWGAPAFPAERMPSGSRPIGEEAFVRTPPTAAVWLPPHEKPKPELTSQATIMFSTHRNHERWKWIAVDSSHSMSG